MRPSPQPLEQPLAVDAIVGMGDEREKTMRSLATAMELTGAEAGS